MGMIIAKFRKKKSNSDLLEKIDKEIKSIENFQRNTEEQRKKIVGQFLVSSVGIYLLSAVLFYFYFYPTTFKERLLYLVPFILAPSFIFILKRLLSMYFNRKLSKNEDKIVDLRAEKKKIIENIMETETYKVARGILEKYAPEQVRKVNLNQELTPLKSAIVPSTPATGLRNRFPAGSRVSMRSNVMQTPGPSSTQTTLSTSMTPMIRNNRSASPNNTQMSILQQTTPMPMQRYIPAKDRTVLDKVVDYLIGDGPNNRYALICKQCSGHNGMALMDEFEYISFTCCYCLTLNPARKQRLVAPKLQFEMSKAGPSSDTSDSEKNSASDTEEEDINSLKESSVNTIFKRDLEHKQTGEDNALSSDNEPNDFDKLSDLESREPEVELVNAGIVASASDKE